MLVIHLSLNGRRTDNDTPNQDSYPEFQECLTSFTRDRTFVLINHRQQCNSLNFFHFRRLPLENMTSVQTGDWAATDSFQSARLAGLTSQRAVIFTGHLTRAHAHRSVTDHDKLYTTSATT